MKKNIFMILSIVFSFTIGIFIGMSFHNKLLENSKIQLEKSLQLTTEKMNKIVKRNEEMEKFLLNSESIIKELESENIKMSEKINSVNDICEEMGKNIINVSSSAENGMSKIMLIQSNQIKITEYINEMKKIMEN